MTTEETHLDLARRFLDLLAPGDPQYRIVPVWYALRAAELQGRAEILRLVGYVRTIPEEHRAHPLILLATASMNELLAAPVLAPEIRRRLMGRSFVATSEAVPSLQRAYRDAAIRGYRRALAADASEAEAGIRLAHLLIGDGCLDEAAALLDRARASAQPPVLQYYAALITGRLHERRGQLPEAERAYRAAAAIAPGAQTPQLALAHALFRSGRAGEARTAIEAVLRPAATRTLDDPWWDYRYGLVMDGNRPVMGLTPRDFELRDSGVLQTIARVDAEQVPLDVVLALDVSHSVAGEPLTRLKAAARATIASLRPEDRAALLGFSHQLLSPARLTTDRAELERAIDSLEPFGSTALYDGAFAGLLMAGEAGRRTLLLLYTDGVDTVSWLEPDIPCRSRRAPTRSSTS